MKKLTTATLLAMQCALTATTACGPGNLPVSAEAATSTEATEDALYGANRRFRVSVRNVTAANVLSPVLAIAHDDSFDLLTTGETASAGLAEVAETGRTDTLRGEVQAATQGAILAQADGPTFAGKTGAFEIEVPTSALARGAKLDLVAMIGRSNDSFIATTNPVNISGLGRGSRLVFAATNFDAGSEENTGNLADFGPGGHPIAAAEGFVSYDRGLNLRGDAPEALAWGTVAAVISIERIR